MLRNIDCQNKPGTDLMHAFVSELECGWTSTGNMLWKHGQTYRSFQLATLVSATLIPVWLMLV